MLYLITVLGMVTSLTAVTLGVFTLVFGIIGLFTKDFSTFKKIARFFGYSLVAFIIVLVLFSIGSAFSR